MKFKITILLTALLACFALKAQEITGVVKDKSTAEALPYATIALQNKSIGVITDEYGNFRLELKNVHPKDTLIISYLGYDALKRSIADVQKNGECLLAPYAFEIAEVQISPADIEAILQKTYDSFYKNHVHKDLNTKGYYREQFFEGNQCVRFGELVFDSKTYEKEGKSYSTLVPQLSRSVEDSVFLKKFNGIFNSRRMLIPFGIDNYFDNGIAESLKIEDFHKFMGNFFFDKQKDGFKVEYNLRDNYIRKGRENYFIKFDVAKKGKNVAAGHFLIDRATYGIAAFEVELNEEENLTRLLIPARFRLIMKIFGFSAEIKGYNAQINNNFEDGKWLVDNGLQVLKGGFAKRGQWFRGKVVNEFHSYYSKDLKYAKATKDFKDVRTNDFASTFWKNYPYAAIQPRQQAHIERIITSNIGFSGEVLNEKVQKKVAKKKAKEKAKAEAAKSEDQE